MTIIILLGVILLGWTCVVNGQGKFVDTECFGHYCLFLLVTEASFSAFSAPSEGQAFYSARCNAVVPQSTLEEVELSISGPPGGNQRPTIESGDSGYESTIIFSELTASNSGTYTCDVMVNGSTAATISAALDVIGEHKISLHSNKIVQLVIVTCYMCTVSRWYSPHYLCQCPRNRTHSWNKLHAHLQCHDYGRDCRSCDLPVGGA